MVVCPACEFERATIARREADRLVGAEALPGGAGACHDEMVTEPRAMTADELRERFLLQCRATSLYWATVPDDGVTVQERLDGMLHALLRIIDGAAGTEGFDLVARPHLDDKAKRLANGANWVEDGTVLNEGVLLHESPTWR